jgi:hypothetical protein
MAFKTDIVTGAARWRLPMLMIVIGGSRTAVHWTVLDRFSLSNIAFRGHHHRRHVVAVQKVRESTPSSP